MDENHDHDLDTGIFWCGVRRVQWVAGSAPTICPCCESALGIEVKGGNDQ